MKSYFNDPHFAYFIRTQPCCDCGRSDYVDRFGNPCVDVSHVKPKGMGGGYKQELGNLIPQCRKCHQIFEKLSSIKKREYLKYAEELSKVYLDAILDEPDIHPYRYA